jgi:hypothetical protein
VTENDVLAALIAAAAVVKLTTLTLKHRATQRAADRKTAKETTR